MVLALTLLLAMPVGTFLALMLFRTNIWGRKFLWIALGSQIAIPLYVFAGGWSAGFGFQGWTNILGFRLTDYVGNSEAGSWGALLAVTAIHSFAAIPWVAMLLSIGLLWVNRSEEEQGLIDGGLVHLFVRVILPKCRIWLAASALSCLVPVATEMVVSNLYQLPTLTEQVYLDHTLGELSPLTYVSSFFFCMLPMAIALLLVLRRAPKLSDMQHKESFFAASVYSLGSWRIAMSLIAWAIMIFLVGLPWFNLVFKSGWTPIIDGDQTSYTWTLERFLTTVDEAITLNGSQYYWSSLLALAASLFALASSLLCFGMFRGNWRWLPAAFCLLLLSVPGPLVGSILIWVLNRSEPAFLGQLYDSTLTAPVLAQQFRLLPFAWLLTCLTFASISPRTWEQADLDELRGIQLLWQVVLPQTKYRWLAIWLLLFVLSFGELSCSILVMPPGVSTISNRLFEFLHFGMRHKDSGICLVLMLFGWAVSYVFWKTLSDR
ncbi:MAG: hypothetical protein AAF483_07170 [Planctomycetota bacterium]